MISINAERYKLEQMLEWLHFVLGFLWVKVPPRQWLHLVMIKT